MLARASTSYPQAEAAPRVGAERIAVLDGIRGLAILLVLIHHFVSTVEHGAYTPLLQALVDMARFTFVGVDIFFVLSGFLIGGIILRSGHEQGFLTRFYVRRAARLLPLYLIVVLLYAICAPFILSSPTPGGDYLVRGGGEALPLWSYLTYLQNVAMATSGQWGGIWLAATWSLAVEEQFYLFAPLLLLMVPRRQLPAVLIALACLSPIIRLWLVILTGNWIASYVLLPARWDALIVGILGALAFQTPAAVDWMRRNRTIVMATFTALSIAMLTMLVMGLPPKHPFIIIIGHSLVALFGLSLIVVAMMEPGSSVAQVMRNRQLVWLGIVSYGIYLINHPVLSLVHWAWDGSKPRLVDTTGVLLTLVALVLTLALAALSWRVFEKPILLRVQSSSQGGGAGAADRLASGPALRDAAAGVPLRRAHA